MELFTADNHAADSAQFIPAESNLSTKINEFLAQNYRHLFPKSCAVDIISGANLNSGNFRCENYYLKIIAHPKVLDFVERFPVIAEHLRKNNVPCNTFLKNSWGEIITTSEEGQDESYVGYIQPFIDGQFYSGRKTEFLECLQLLPKMESALKKFKPTSDQQKPYWQWDPLELYNKIKVEVKASNGNLYDSIHPRMNLIESAISYYIDNEVHFRQNYLRHYDLHPHNLLFKNGKLISVLDLESFRTIPAELFAGFTLYKLGRKSIYCGEHSIESFKRIVGTHYDLTALKNYAQIELVRRILLILDLNYLRKIADWNHDLSKHTLGLLETERMFAE